jgi:hypothetical protein
MDAQKAELTDGYLRLLDSTLAPYGMEQDFVHISSDPWSPTVHCILRVEEKKFLGFIPYRSTTRVATVESEPAFARGEMGSASDYNGLKIHVSDPGAMDALEAFRRQYRRLFRERVKIKLDPSE